MTGTNEAANAIAGAAGGDDAVTESTHLQAIPKRAGITAKRRGRSAAEWTDIRAAAFFLLPTMLGFLLFVAGPLISAVALSLTRYDIITPPQFVGLANYRLFLQDDRLRHVYGNTLVLVASIVTLDVAIGLALALAVNRKMPALLRYLFRTAYFFPVLTSLASIAIIWSFLLNYDFGVVNYYLGKVGIARVPWLTASNRVIPAIVLVSVWKNVGFSFVLFVAGLQAIPRVYYEAARIDGAGSWTIFRNITLPLISPTMFFATVIGLINGFQIFDAPQILTNGGPGDNSRTVVMYIFEQGFRNFAMGYASTIALSLFFVLLTLTLIQTRLSRKWVFYS